MNGRNGIYWRLQNTSGPDGLEFYRRGVRPVELEKGKGKWQSSRDGIGWKGIPPHSVLCDTELHYVDRGVIREG